MTLSLTNCRVQIGEAVLLDQVGLSCTPGTLTAIVGPNGAGKSTLLALLSGERPPSSGKAVLDGTPLHTWSATDLARRRAIVPQHVAPAFDMRAWELVRLGRAPFTDSREDEVQLITAALAAMDALHLANRDVMTLSGGERQRVGLARALAQIAGFRSSEDAHFLLLDEPTAALDLKHARAVMQTTRTCADQGVCVIVVLHDLRAAARYADQVVLLHRGSVAAQGIPAEVLTAPRVETVFEVDPETALDALGTPALTPSRSQSRSQSQSQRLAG